MHIYTIYRCSAVTRQERSSIYALIKRNTRTHSVKTVSAFLALLKIKKKKRFIFYSKIQIHYCTCWSEPYAGPHRISDQ